MIQGGISRELSHFHGEFKGFSLSIQSRMIRSSGNRKHVHVDVRCRPLVQANLFMTKEVALSEGRKVHEPKIDGFFDLVGKGSGQKNPGNMSFPKVEMGDRMRVKMRILQGSKKSERIVEAHGSR